MVDIKFEYSFYINRKSINEVPYFKENYSQEEDAVQVPNILLRKGHCALFLGYQNTNQSRFPINARSKQLQQPQGIPRLQTTQVPVSTPHLFGHLWTCHTDQYPAVATLQESQPINPIQTPTYMYSIRHQISYKILILVHKLSMFFKKNRLLIEYFQYEAGVLPQLTNPQL